MSSFYRSAHNIEDTHLTDPKRLEKLFAIVCIAFVWVYLVGDYQNQVKKISILSHNRRAFSIFRYGLDAINKALLFDKQLVIVYSQLLTCIMLPQIRHFGLPCSFVCLSYRPHHAVAVATPKTLASFARRSMAMVGRHQFGRNYGAYFCASPIL